MNNQTKHTPGPWLIYGRDIDTNKIEICQAGITRISKRLKVAEVLPQPSYEDTQAANARLIAAAPELLAVIEKLLGTPCPDQAFVWLETTGIAALAVAARDKATGKEDQQ